jgi:hypothetical protein
MKRSSVLNDELSPSEIEEFNRATDAMRRNRLERFSEVGDIDGYLQFLEERQELFGPQPKTFKRLFIDKSNIL